VTLVTKVLKRTGQHGRPMCLDVGASQRMPLTLQHLGQSSVIDTLAPGCARLRAVFCGLEVAVEGSVRNQNQGYSANWVRLGKQKQFCQQGEKLDDT